MPSANLPMRIFGPCRSAMMATSRPSVLRALAHEARALDVVGGAAVREVEADDVDARGEHPRQHSGVAAGGAERGDDLGGAWQGIPSGCAVRERDMLRELRPRRCGAAGATCGVASRRTRAARGALAGTPRGGAAGARSGPARLQHRHGRQRLALEELEERAARRSRCSEIRSAMPNLSIAATVSPPPAIENAATRRSPRRAPACRRRTRRTRTRRPGRSRRSCRPWR